MKFPHLTRPAGPWLHLFVAAPAEACNAVWGLDQSTGGQFTTNPVDGTIHLFVVQIDYGAGNAGNDRVRMYVDPTPGLSAPDVTPALYVTTF